MMQEMSVRPCGLRVLLEGEEKITTTVCLDEVNSIWGITGKNGVHVLGGCHFVIGSVLAPVREGVVMKRSKGHS